MDAGSRDAIPGQDAESMDAEPVDSGAPIDCPAAMPLEVGGGATGNTTNGVNNIDPPFTCFPPLGRELVYTLTLPGRVKTLDISLTSTDPNFMFIPGLQVYRDSCDEADLVACQGGDEFDLAASLHLTQLDPGQYAIVADSVESAGLFNLLVDGVISTGEPCDPLQTYLTCEIGDCSDEGGGDFRCRRLLDCVDGVDADQDGMTDEDTCNLGPTVMCPAAAQDVNAGGTVALTATPMDDLGIEGRLWTVDQQPFASRPSGPAPADTLNLYLDLIGSYRAHYVAYDEAFQAAACDVTLTAGTNADLYVEMYWLEEPFSDFDVDLTLIQPSATNWLDLACRYPGCSFDWSVQGDGTDDPGWSGDAPGDPPTRSAEYAFVASPEQNARYGVGISALNDIDDVHVKIYCGGVLEEVITSTDTIVPMIPGDPVLLGGQFWKVADVMMMGGNCSVLPLSPVPVDQFDADAMR